MKSWNNRFADISGWEDDNDGWEDDDFKPCNNRHHEPPGYLVIPPGKIFRHVCPGCGTVTRIRGIETRWK